MKRILVFAGFFYPHIGGSVQVIHELSKRLVKRGYEIDVITCNVERMLAYEELDGVCIYRLPSWNILGGTYPIPKPTLTTFRIYWGRLKGPHDMVFTFTRFFITSFMGVIISTLKHKPLIHTELGSRHSFVSNKMVDLISKTYDHTVGSLIVTSAWKTIGNSNATCDFMRHLGAKETIMIHNGIDTNVFRKKSSTLRNKLMLDDSVVITFVGRLIYAKGVHDLISVFLDLERESSNLRLLIVSDGPNRQELERLAEASCNKKNILFLGWRTREEIVEILSITDIFVNPSYSEGLPTSVLEAAAVGLPIVATDVGGTNEIIENYKTGLLVPPGDIKLLKEKIFELINDKKLRTDLARNAHTVIKEEFDYDIIVTKYEDICEEIVEKITDETMENG